LIAAAHEGRIAPKLRSMATPSREALGTRRRGGRGGLVTAMTWDETPEGSSMLKQGLQPIVNGLDREAMERRSGRASASPREPNRRHLAGLCKTGKTEKSA